MPHLETGKDQKVYPPYYIVPEVEAYQRLDPRSEEAVKLSRKIAANIGDFAALRLVLGIDPPEFARFYPDMETSSPSTMDTIDSFLDKFGTNLGSDILSSEGVSLNYMLEEEEIQPTVDISKSTEEIILEKNVEPQEEVIDLGILIKNKRYSEALEFIEAQNLNNREKSIYFAHQIRFIKKLMAIENFRNKTKG